MGDETEVNSIWGCKGDASGVVPEELLRRAELLPLEAREGVELLHLRGRAPRRRRLGSVRNGLGRIRCMVLMLLLKAVRDCH